MKIQKVAIYGAIVASVLVASIGVTIAKIGKGQMKPNVPPAVQKAVKTIVAARKAADKAGNYDCCMHPDCNYCMEHFGKCDCAEKLAANKGVCIECKGGWDAGMGSDPKRDPKTVKVMKMPKRGAMGGMKM